MSIEQNSLMKLIQSKGDRYQDGSGLYINDSIRYLYPWPEDDLLNDCIEVFRYRSGEKRPWLIFKDQFEYAASKIDKYTFFKMRLVHQDFYCPVVTSFSLKYRNQDLLCYFSCYVRIFPQCYQAMWENVSEEVKERFNDWLDILFP